MEMVSSVREAKIFIIDNPLSVRGIEGLLEGTLAHVSICGSASNMVQACDVVSKFTDLPDLVIMDIKQKSGVSLESIKQFCALHENLRILVLSTEPEEVYALRALKAGAIGYISKFENAAFIEEKIKSALEGKLTVSPEVNERILGMYANKPKKHTTNSVACLSDRELEILLWIGRGKGTRHIAEALHLSTKTVESHRTHIREKMNLKSGAELVHFAYTYAQE